MIKDFAQIFADLHLATRIITASLPFAEGKIKISNFELGANASS